MHRNKGHSVRLGAFKARSKQSKPCCLSCWVRASRSGQKVLQFALYLLDIVFDLKPTKQSSELEP